MIDRAKGGEIRADRIVQGKGGSSNFRRPASPVSRGERHDPFDETGDYHEEDCPRGGRRAGHCRERGSVLCLSPGRRRSIAGLTADQAATGCPRGACLTVGRPGRGCREAAGRRAAELRWRRAAAAEDDALRRAGRGYAEAGAAGGMGTGQRATPRGPIVGQFLLCCIIIPFVCRCRHNQNEK